ncbi:hypothetical protein AHF37_07324 [Paragonimus kellicotti]|nr:hypothetical protein AHF37_07324 [Paragonimus kellicotti]
MTLQICRIAVSSVLNKDSKQYGKAHLFDGNPETCWNSDHGSPQWIHIHLQSPVRLEAIRVQFQGGFSGLDMSLEAWNDGHTTGPLLSTYALSNIYAQTTQCYKWKTAQMLMDLPAAYCQSPQVLLDINDCMSACQSLHGQYAALSKPQGCWCTNSSMSSPVECGSWLKNFMFNSVGSVISKPAVQLLSPLT